MNRLTSYLILTYLSSLLFISQCESKSKTETKPKRANIMFILMDDVGWHDVSFMGSQIPTPNIDALHSESVFLSKHYIHLMCSPSRSQIITGRYPMYQGFGKMMPWDYTELGGIPVGQPTVANWLKSIGKYATYAVGKWHMGYAYQGLLPGSRGFDHFYGFYQGAIHYDNLKYIDIKFGDSNHFDFWEDGKESHIMQKADIKTLNSMRLYAQKIIQYIYDDERDDDTPFYMYVPLQTIHGPLNEVHEKEDECVDILGENASNSRHKYCQNMLLTDDIIGDIIAALHASGEYDDTLIVFTSDNGADVSNSGCNYPLRGTKGTLFDGNIKTLALIGGGVIPQQQRGTQRDVLFSSLDWTPTLLSFAQIYDDIGIKDRTWDGVNQYDLIMSGVDNNQNKKRNHIVLNIGLRDFSSASIVFEKDDILYKYVSENEDIDTWAYKRDDGWCEPDEYNNWAVILDTDISLSSHVDNKYLFDLTNDMSEKTNLLQLQDNTNSNQELTKYAKKLLKPYIEHQLYGEYLWFLWVRMPAGDPSQLGEGAFVAPFLTELEYFKHVSRGFSGIEEEFKNAAAEAKANGERFNEKLPYSKALKGLYFQKWKPPNYENNVIVSHGKSQNALLWYIYVIIAVVIVAFIMIVAVSVMKYRQYKNIYRDGYQPIKQKDNINVDAGKSAFVAIS